jgi:hypothetical protein
MSEVSPLYVEIPVELKEWLYAKAKTEDRTVTAVLRRLLQDEQRRCAQRPKPTKVRS